MFRVCFSLGCFSLSGSNIFVRSLQIALVLSFFSSLLSRRVVTFLPFLCDLSAFGDLILVVPNDEMERKTMSLKYNYDAS